jgi:coproporphyrinogen III oxidase-like Fe-S oxidoreductase
MQSEMFDGARLIKRLYFGSGTPTCPDWKKGPDPIFIT